MYRQPVTVRLIRLQNLIPLLLRPLRLVLASERLRSARIVLLKATHAPFIGAIYAYEHFAGQKPLAGAVSISGPETPTLKWPPRFSGNPPRPLSTHIQASTDGN